MKGRRVRIDIIDGMRGHLLIGMIIAHAGIVLSKSGMMYVHHFMVLRLWDAEFFVPISGFLVGYLCCGDPARKRSVFPFLVGRLGVIYRYLLICFLPGLLLSIAAAAPGGDVTAVVNDVVDMLLLQRGAFFAHVLIIYFACFLLCGAFALSLGEEPDKWLLASFLIWCVAQVTGRTGFFGVIGGELPFDVGAWQFLFVLSFWCGARTEQIRARIAGLSGPAALSLCAGLVLFFFASGFLYKMGPGWDWFTADASRIQLNAGFLARICAACAIAVLILSRGERAFQPLRRVMVFYFTLRPLRAIGKYSIQAFTLHVLLCALLFQLDLEAMSVTDQRVAAAATVAVFVAAMLGYARMKRRARAAA